LIQGPYAVEFSDGEATVYSANIIAQILFAQCDMEGNQFLLMPALVVDHKKDGHAVEIADGFVHRGSNRHRRITAKGWQLCVK